MCVCVRERENVCDSVRQRECVCVRVRERERMCVGESVCMGAHVH